MRFFTVEKEVYVSCFFGREHRSMEASPTLPELRRTAGSCHHRTFLNRHRHCIGAPIDEEVRRYRKRQVVIRNRIFDELVVAFLEFSIGVMVFFKESSCILYLRKISVAKPLNFLGFGKFRKTVNLFHFYVLGVSGVLMTTF